MTYGSPGRGTRDDPEGLQEINRLGREQRRADAQPVVVSPEHALYIRSPNGTYFSLAVDDAGVLSTVSVGTSL